MRFLLVFSFLLAGWVFAQPAEHSVNISIPSLLQLRIHDELATDLRVPLEILQTAEGFSLSTKETRLELLANTGWQLQVRLEQTPHPFQISASLNQTILDLNLKNQVLAAGGLTRGWQELIVSYDLTNPMTQSTEQSYPLDIYYFLSQP